MGSKIVLTQLEITAINMNRYLKSVYDVWDLDVLGKMSKSDLGNDVWEEKCQELSLLLCSYLTDSIDLKKVKMPENIPHISADLDFERYVKNYFSESACQFAWGKSFTNNHMKEVAWNMAIIEKCCRDSNTYHIKDQFTSLYVGKKNVKYYSKILFLIELLMEGEFDYFLNLDPDFNF